MNIISIGYKLCIRFVGILLHIMTDGKLYTMVVRNISVKKKQLPSFQLLFYFCIILFFTLHACYFSDRNVPQKCYTLSRFSLIILCWDLDFRVQYFSTFSRSIKRDVLTCDKMLFIVFG